MAKLPTATVSETVAQFVGGAAPAEPAAPSYDLEQLKAASGWSNKIRYLHRCGLTRGQIVKAINANFPRKNLMLYQHVRNVLITPVKKS